MKNKFSFNKSKKYVFVIAVIVLITFSFAVFAKNQPNGQPFQAVWDAINELKTSGIAGSQGPQGPEGPQGPSGESSWDEDRIAEIEEELEILRNRECFLGDTLSCDTGLLGACSAGTKACGEDLLWGDCVSENEPVEEICDDGIDNDCDGEIDEEC